MTTNLSLIFVIRFSSIIIYYAANYVFERFLTAIKSVFTTHLCVL